MSISEPFIRRPIATALLMLGVLVFGVAAYNLLPVAALPNVDFPTITVTANYPGASPQTMASAIATPLEQQFTAIPDLDQMTSLSGIGTTTITLQFGLSHNIDGAAVDVQTAINAASGLLPTDLPSPPTYRKVNPADFPVLIYAIHSKALPVYRLDDYANIALARAAVDGEGRRAGLHLRPKTLCRARPGQSRQHSRRTASASRTCAMPSWRRPSTSRRARSRVPTGRTRSTPTISCSTPPPTARSSSPTAMALRCSSRMSAMSSIRCRTRASAPGSTTCRPRASPSTKRRVRTPWHSSIASRS